MNPPERRSDGTGSLHVYKGTGGKETWYGRWRVGKKRVKRRIGPKRKPGGRTGLTRTQAEAEAELRRLMVAGRVPLDGDEVSLTAAAEHMLRTLKPWSESPPPSRTIARCCGPTWRRDLAKSRSTKSHLGKSRIWPPRCGTRAWPPRPAQTHSSCCRRSSPSPSAAAGAARIPASLSAAPRSSRARHPLPE